MNSKFATVLGSAVKNFEGEKYHRVIAIDCYAVGDVIPWADVAGETVQEGRAFNVLQMYTTSEAFNSAKLQAKALEGLTL